MFCSQAASNLPDAAQSRFIVVVRVVVAGNRIRAVAAAAQQHGFKK
jgi:hypothetical protein